VGDLKALIFSQTTVPPERQKILSLVKGKLPDDEVALSHLQLHERAGKEFTVLGNICCMYKAGQ
jgi:ubiquitin-like domain-containing CTD phosphatase 1